MNTIDIIFSLFFMVIFYFGFKKGIIRQLTNQTNLFFALIASFYFYDKFSLYLQGKLAIPSVLSTVIAIILIFIIVIISMTLIAMSIEKLIKLLRLSFLNQILGGVFAFLKYILYILFPFFIITSLNNKFHFYTISNGSFWYSFFTNSIKIFSNNLL